METEYPLCVGCSEVYDDISEPLRDGLCEECWYESWEGKETGDE